MSRESKAIEWAIRNSGGDVRRFAKAVGVSSTTVYRWIDGSRDPFYALRSMAEVSGDPEEFARRFFGLNRGEWPDPQQADAMDATLGAAKAVWRSVAQLYHRDGVAAFGKMHAGFAAVYLLAYEAGRVQGIAQGGETE